MHVRSRVIAGVAVLSAALLSTSPLSIAGATTAPLAAPAPAAAAHKLPTVVAHVSSKAIHLSVGHRLHAGRVIFRVMTRHGGHTLQLLRLHKGYTMQQAGQDIGKAFQGDTDAIRRIDHRISWLGGAAIRPGHPGEFAVNLRAARLVVLDQDSNAFTQLRVFGTPRPRHGVPASSGITTFSYGFGLSTSTLPHEGWTRASNRSDQPHFIEFMRVKDGTTDRQVRKFIRSGAHGNPPWALKANTDIGVISPNRSEMFHYRLPAGKYLLACFWPDDDSGMPHFFMGMWKLIHLK